MTTLTSSRLYEIFLGTPTTDDEDVTILGLGPTGDATAKHRLVHPDSENFEPILYFLNPDRVMGMDNEALHSPITAVHRALEGSLVTRFEGDMTDVIVTEVWLATDNKFSMPGFQFRQLYEYLVNTPAWVPANPIYIQYSPQSKNQKTWNVELLRLVVGSGGDPSQLFDVMEFFPGGVGSAQGDPLAYLDEAFANEGSGLLDRTVVLQMKLVSEV